MSTEPTTGGTEPTDTQVTNPTEEVTDDAGASTTDDKSTEESSKTLSAEEKRQHVVDSFKRKLESGELTKEEIPEKQAWVLKEIENSQQKETAQPDISALVEKTAKEQVEKILKQEKEAQAVQSLRDKIADARPSLTVKEFIKKEFDTYKDSLGEEAALKLAVRLSGLNVSPEAVKRSRMHIPEGVDTAKNSPSHDEVIADQANRSDEDLMAAMRASKGL
ncbi:hypothetical protein HN682_08065 [Candidatus Peregrinibacteria bacterium]|jgi:hypothetical protein|nr:hypothetical protein [Candidatus Peregrinibacteria bacterium]